MTQPHVSVLFILCCERSGRAIGDGILVSLDIESIVEILMSPPFLFHAVLPPCV